MELLACRALLAAAAGPHNDRPAAAAAAAVAGLREQLGGVRGRVRELEAERAACAGDAAALRERAEKAEARARQLGAEVGGVPVRQCCIHKQCCPGAAVLHTQAVLPGCGSAAYSVQP